MVKTMKKRKRVDDDTGTIEKESITLSRKELQAYLKFKKLPAAGTNDILRSRYIEARKIEATASTTTAAAAAVPNYGQEGVARASVATVVVDETDDVVCVGVQESPSPQKKKKSAPSPSEKKKKQIIKKEKRARRYVSKCSAAVQQRIERALTQKLYLIQRGDVMPTTTTSDSSSSATTNDASCEFVVLGSTGNVYQVTIKEESDCSCPDRARGNLCKHILFILLKVVGLSSTSSHVYQKALLATELKEIFALMLTRQKQQWHNTRTLANKKVRTAYQKGAAAAAATHVGDDDDNEDDPHHSKKRQAIEGDCPICFDNMDVTQEAITFCRAICGANFHSECIHKWLHQHKKKSNKTCPSCRCLWEHDGSSSSSSTTAKKEGYTNLAKLQGLSTKRDTSTYSEWYNYKRY